MKRINFEDIIQVCIGSAIMAIPIAFTQESWQLSKTLPAFKIFLIFVTSILFNACFIYYGIYQGNLKGKVSRFISRIGINYLITLITITYLLYILDILSLSNSPYLWLSKIIVISFPASLGGAIIDSFDKE
jgi:uncharacterized membrane protein